MQKRMENFQGDEEEMKASGSVAYSGGYHIKLKLGADLSPGNCSS